MLHELLRSLLQVVNLHILGLTVASKCDASSGVGRGINTLSNERSLGIDAERLP